MPQRKNKASADQGRPVEEEEPIVQVEPEVIEDVSNEDGGAVGGNQAAATPSSGAIPKTRSTTGRQSKKRERQLRELQQQIADEQHEVELLEQQSQLQALRRRRAQLVNESRGNSLPIPGPSSPSPPSPVNNLSNSIDQAASVGGDLDEPVIDLDTVRQAPGIQSEVDARIADLGLGAVPEIDNSNNNPRGRKPVSGRLTKVENHIVKQVVWPHVVIEPKFVSKSVSYDELDFPLLVAGELGIALSRGTSEQELRNRLNLLRLLAYCYRNCGWDTVRQFHSSALTEVERGQRQWTDNRYSDITTGVLLVAANNRVDQAVVGAAQPAVVQAGVAAGPAAPQAQQGRPARRGRQQRSAAPRVGPARYFCKAFNQGNCVHNGAHRGTVGGREQLVEHICATCWLEFGEAVPHAEVKDCPRYRYRQ
jgi:hypothetical protein